MIGMGRNLAILYCCLAMVLFSTVIVLPYAAENVRTLQGEKYGVTVTHNLTSTLLMVSYERGWFGIGVQSTTATLQNGTEKASFTFDQDLPLVIGKTYTVTYNETSLVYYNATVTDSNPFNIIGSSNSTTIKPLDIYLTENEQ